MQFYFPETNPVADRALFLFVLVILYKCLPHFIDGIKGFASAEFPVSTTAIRFFHPTSSIKSFWNYVQTKYNQRRATIKAAGL